MAIRYRLATLDDAAAIAELHAESQRRHYRGSYSDAFLDGPIDAERREYWARRMSAPRANQHVIMAEEGDALLGFACAYGGDDPQFGTLLDNLHVRADQHGRGVGTALVMRVVAWAREYWPGRGLFLWVLEKNVTAQGFYKRMGAVDRGNGERAEPGGRPIILRRYAWNSLGDVMSRSP